MSDAVDPAHPAPRQEEIDCGSDADPEHSTGPPLGHLYSVTADPLNRRSYRVAIASSAHPRTEIYDRLAAALLRADDIRRGRKSAAWIIKARLDPIQTLENA